MNPSIAGLTTNEFRDKKFSNVDFVESLVTDMVQSDPSKRPTIAEVVDRFSQIRLSLDWQTLRSRLVPKGESKSDSLWNSVIHFVRTVGYIITRRSAIPTLS